jgi:hypothetical protein
VPRPSTHTLILVRDMLVNRKTAREIREFFAAQEFRTPPESESYPKRDLVDSCWGQVDWQSPDHLARGLTLLQILLIDLAIDGRTVERTKLLQFLAQDGFELNDERKLLPVGSPLVPLSTVDLASDAAVRLHVERMRLSALSDPEAAIGSAKDLLESTSKFALEVLGASIAADADLPLLIKTVHQNLNLYPGAVAPTDTGAESIKKTLGGLSAIAIGVAELRNQYGTGHGRARKVSGLTERHALLAVNTASTYADFILATLRDPNAPWKIQKV